MDAVASKFKYSKKGTYGFTDTRSGGRMVPLPVLDPEMEINVQELY